MNIVKIKLHIFTAVSICFLLGLCSAMLTYAHKIPVHMQMTENAALQSNLNNRLKDIGIESLDQVISYKGDSAKVSTSRSVLKWITYGSKREDDLFALPPRVKHHFYDPTPGAPNGGGLVFKHSLFGLQKGRPSIRWGLEDQGDISGQLYSYKDARDYFYKALTAPLLSSDFQKYLTSGRITVG